MYDNSTSVKYMYLFCVMIDKTDSLRELVAKKSFFQKSTICNLEIVN